MTPINTVTVRTRLDGELVKVNFTEGQRVAKGQVLAEIDTRPYQVQLAQAQGALEENRARLRNAETDLERYQKLQQEQLITAQQVVGQEAQVRQLNGAIQSSEAQVASARLNLNYARIVAPIDGKLGLRQVDAGNMVRSGDAERPRRHHPDAADLGDLHGARDRAAAGPRGDARRPATVGRGLGSR